MPEAKVIKNPLDGKYYWYAACGKKDDSGYNQKKDAEVALRLHENGCKDC